MKKMTKLWMIAAILLCGTMSFVSCSDKDDEVIVYSTPLRTIITNMSYGDNVLVVGHKSPDCDAVCSAMVYIIYLVASLLFNLSMSFFMQKSMSPV